MLLAKFWLFPFYQLEVFSNRWQASILYKFYRIVEISVPGQLFVKMSHLVLQNISPKYDPNEFCTTSAPNFLQNFLIIFPVNFEI